ncbi:unnamed protein product [Euphydryas editha]|uniref:Uncharacterized protein n=1 Tax=Euphydryas editha TaxID=104508 RepID=A0AAU9U460_EUPED|nr:unnamed protein product [Euphydryas editha]
MEQYTPKERAEIVQLYIQNNFLIMKTKRAFRKKNEVKIALDDDRATVTVNGERYRAMITDFLMPIIRENDMDDYWFRQDGAICHTARGYFKSKVYANKPRTLAALKNNIHQEIAAISAETMANVIENAEKRAHLVAKARGGHLRDIIFKK